MPKDLKIGIFLGLVLVAIAAVWLSMRPSLSTRARLLQSNLTTPAQTRADSHFYNSESSEKSTEAVRFVTELPNTSSTQAPAQTQTVPPFASPKPKQTKTQRFHIVRHGETLSGISYKYYGSANKWQKILEANRSTIKDANKLRPGTQLIIPE